MFPQEDNAGTGNCLTCEQVKILNMFRRLWIEHVLWTRFFVISTAFCLPDLPYVTQRLLQNPVDFAEALCPFYGKQAAARFGQLLEEHLLIAAQLVNALKCGDAKEAEAQRRKWYKNAEEIACFLASINPNWSECEWQRLLFDHLRMTEDEAAAILNGRYECGIKEYDDIQAEALKMADAMACGIIRQFCIK